jgi:hypothetical protein
LTNTNLHLQTQTVNQATSRDAHFKHFQSGKLACNHVKLLHENEGMFKGVESGEKIIFEGVE